MSTPGSPARWDYTRTGRLVLTGLWIDALLVMAASAWNGGRALAALGDPFLFGSLLGFAVDVGLAVALIGDRALHLAGKPEPWGRALRIVTAVMSGALNCGVAAWEAHYGLALFHGFLPVLLVLLSEYAQASTLQFRQITAEYHATVKDERDAQLAADRARWDAERSKQTTPPFAAVATAGGVGPAPIAPVSPGRPDLAPAVPPAGQPDRQPVGRPTGQTAGQPDRPARTTPAGRPGTAGPGRKRTAKPKTDDQLAAAVRDMTEQNGGTPPSQYQIRQALGVGGTRAARLVAELDTTPAGPPAGNGAATRKDAAR